MQAAYWLRRLTLRTLPTLTSNVSNLTRASSTAPPQPSYCIWTAGHATFSSCNRATFNAAESLQTASMGTFYQQKTQTRERMDPYSKYRPEPGKTIKVSKRSSLFGTLVNQPKLCWHIYMFSDGSNSCKLYSWHSSPIIFHFSSRNGPVRALQRRLEWNRQRAALGCAILHGATVCDEQQGQTRKAATARGWRRCLHLI